MEEYLHSYVVKSAGRIGNGGFGFVEKVEVFNTSGLKCGDYAKKVLSPSQGLNKDDFRRRFKREVDYQAKCVHTNIAPIYLHNLNTENPWFVMDLAESDLSQDLNTGNLSDSNKVNIALMILEGVKYMHEDQLDKPSRKPVYLHRDLKPSNILRFKDGVYKISDFGLVKNAGKEGESEILTKVATAMGTKKYMAPEILNAGLYSVQTDIFALGIVIDDMNLPGTKLIVDKSTLWRAAGRYQTIDEMMHDLKEYKIRNGL